MSNKHIVADLNDKLIAAEIEVGQLKSQLTICRGEIAGYKLAARGLNRFGGLFLKTVVAFARNAAVFSK